jgi:hypothetical protein
LRTAFGFAGWRLADQIFSAFLSLRRLPGRLLNGWRRLDLLGLTGSRGFAGLLFEFLLGALFRSASITLGFGLGLSG